MKTKLFLLTLLTNVTLLSAININLKVSNPENTEVKDYPIIVKLNDYKNITAKEYQNLAVFIAGNQVSSQIDDLNNDGTADELVFLVTLGAKETKKVALKTITPDKRINFPTEVYTDLISKGENGKMNYIKEISSSKNDMYNKMHHHGVAFESDLIGYRIYFDNKSTIDLYGKKKQQLELATTGWYPTDEQAAEGYGDDVLTVYGSIGVGTVKGWDGIKATNIDKFDKRTQRIISTGKLRTVVESEVDGWQYEGKKIDMKVRYILYARHRDAICEVRASENIDNLATGVEIIKNGPTLSEKGLVGSWGTDYPVTDTIKYAKQTCGLGVHVPAKSVNSQVVAGIDNLILMKYKKGEVLTFNLTAAAMKEEKNPYTSFETFFAYLKKWNNQLNSKSPYLHK